MLKFKGCYQLLTTLCLAVFPSFICSKQPILNIYAWGNYLPNEIILEFTKETGIKVNLVEYDNNETMFAKLKASQQLDYDLILPSSYYVERMGKQGMLQPLNHQKLTSLQVLNPLLLNRAFDLGNRYSIPYLWGTTGIIVNNKYYPPNQLKYWRDFWQPQYANRLMILNDMRDVFSLALLALGYSINDSNPQHIKAAYLKLVQLLKNIKLFSIDTVPNIYVDEEALIGMAWSGDCKLAQQENPALHYIYPADGFVIWIDSFAIPKNAPHLENAYKFLNFILRPAIASRASLIVGHTSANQAAVKLLPKSLQNNPVINPPKTILGRGQIQQDLPEKILQLYEKYWEKLKIN